MWGIISVQISGLRHQAWEIILSLVLVAGICEAGDGTYHQAGKSCASFLKLDIGARAASLGGAYSAVADGVEGMCWNPAGLCQIKGKEISLIHHNWIEDMNHGFIGYAQPMNGKSVLGMGIVGLFVDSLERRSGATIKHEGSFKADDTALIINYSREIGEGLLGGINAKVIHQGIDKEAGYGVCGDGGIIYACKGSGLKLSAVIQNLGPRMKIYREKFDMPLAFRFGTAYRTSGCQNRYLQRIMICTEISKPIDNRATLHLGTEYKVMEAMTLRCGYRYKFGQPEHEFLSGLSGGAGIAVKGFGLDYTYSNYHEFGDAHQIGVNIRF